MTVPFSITQRHMLMIALAIIIVFSPAFVAQFSSWDDPGHVFNNEFVKNFSLSSIPQILGQPDTANSTYIPLTIIMFGIEHSIAGMTPFIFHFNNILLHIIVSLLAYHLGRRWGLSANAALLAVLIFALHPTKVEVVAWITARKDLLYSTFYLLALHQYTSYISTTDTKQKTRQYLLTLAFGVLAILSKPMALSLPWILLLVDWFHGRKITLSVLVEKIPFFAIIDGIGLITFLQNRRHIPLSFPTSPMMWLWSMAFYIEKFIFPVNLNPAYTVPSPINLSNPEFIKAMLIVVGVIAGGYYFRRHRWLIFGLLFFYGSIFFLIRMDYIADVSIVADRFLYLTSFGMCLAIGHGWDVLKRDSHLFVSADKIRLLKKVTVPFIAIILLAFGAYSFYLSRFWKDSLTFWTRTITIQPDFAIGYYNRGLDWMTKKEYEKAIADFERSMVFAKDNPRHYKMPYSYLMSGLCYLKLGRGEKALENVDLAVTMMPEEATMHYNKGYVLSSLGHYQKSLPFFERAILLEPNNASYYNDRAITYKRLGRIDEALADYSKAISLDEKLFTAYVNRGLLYLSQQKESAAMNDFLKAIDINSKDTTGYKQAGALYFKQGNIPKALDFFEKAAKEDPEDKEVHFNLGILYKGLKQENLAMKHFQEAQRLGYQIPGGDSH